VKTIEIPKDMTLTNGCHKSPEDGMCVMEAAAWLAGEPFSDAPKCVSVLELRRLSIRLNDAMWPSDAERTAALLPYLPRLMRATATEEQRSRIRFKLADIAVREIAVSALRGRGRTEDADRLAALPEIVDRETAQAAAYAAAAADADAAYAYAYADADAAAAAAADAAAYAAADAADAAAAARGATLKKWTDRLLGAALEICEEGRAEA